MNTIILALYVHFTRLSIQVNPDARTAKMRNTGASLPDPAAMNLMKSCVVERAGGMYELVTL